MLYDFADLKIKVVQIYEDMPWHYYGLRHELWCQSSETMDVSLAEMEKGWIPIGTALLNEPGQSPSSEIRKRALDDAAAIAQGQLQIINKETVVFVQTGLLQVYFNGCGGRGSLQWNGWQLSEDMIDAVKRSGNCVSGNCPWENFEGDREITFTDIQVDSAAKSVSFQAHSKAFKGGILSASSKVGEAWHITQKSP